MTTLVKQKSNSIISMLSDPGAVTQFARMLPQHMTAERFTRIGLSVIRNNPSLMGADPLSLIGALMKCAQMGLEPGIGDHVYLITYGQEVTVQTGWRGELELAQRSGKLKYVTVQEVRENDTFSYEYGTDQHLTHKPAMKERGEVICYYAYLAYVDGGDHFEVMSVEDVTAHKLKYVKKETPAWKTAFDSMAKKTVLRKALNYSPKSIELIREAQQMEGSTVRVSKQLDSLEYQPLDEEDFVADEAPQVLKNVGKDVGKEETLL